LAHTTSIYIYNEGFADGRMSFQNPTKIIPSEIGLQSVYIKIRVKMPFFSSKWCKNSLHH